MAKIYRRNTISTVDGQRIAEEIRKTFIDPVGGRTLPWEEAVGNATPDVDPVAIAKAGWEKWCYDAASVPMPTVKAKVDPLK